MNWIIKLVLMFIGHQAKVGVLREVKRTGALAYLRVLQGSRRFLILSLAAFLILQLMVLSAFGALVTGFLIWNHDFAAKMEILFWVFAALFSLPFMALLVGFSERFWYKASGAERIVDSLRNE